MEIPQRIEELRGCMTNAGVDAYIITGADPHGSEMPSERWHTRKWISGFKGSAGTVIITQHSAGLWTDSRYWIQAERELAGSGMSLHCVGKRGILQPYKWLIQNLELGAVVGFDGHTVDFQTAQEWEMAFTEAGLSIKASLDLLGNLWTERPLSSAAPIIELSESECGESRSTRLSRLRSQLRETGTDTWIATAMDSAAWLLNVRSEDLPYTPVVQGYLIVSADAATWYIGVNRLTDELSASLRKDGITVAPYDAFIEAIMILPTTSHILIDPELLNYSVLTHLPQGVVKHFMPDPVYRMKSIKNSVELAHLRRAMEKDGAALVKFFFNIERQLAQGALISEYQAVEFLHQQRSCIQGFLGNSFPTIAAFGPNSAMCHYETIPEHQYLLNSTDGLFLLDSGGQWQEGTTDITRTVKFGPPTKEEIRDYTMVLKAHIALSRIRFPTGTRGYQLDVVPRMELWQAGIDYGHGTGHGVGFRLGVHEGPQIISPKPVNVSLEPGMVISNEPGIYREGYYGIRIENLMVCQNDEKNEFGDFLSFETLSLAPYHRNLIDTNFLNTEEIQWIDRYHSEVRKRLHPWLGIEERKWLWASTEVIGR